jgi:hypothetical protein
MTSKLYIILHIFFESGTKFLWIRTSADLQEEWRCLFSCLSPFRLQGRIWIQVLRERLMGASRQYSQCIFKQ